VNDRLPSKRLLEQEMNHRLIGALVWEPRTEISKSPFNAVGRRHFQPESLGLNGKGENAMKLGQSTEGVHSPAT
jgi:hypothetical protein